MVNLNVVTPGKKVPDQVNVIIEIPCRGEPVKYEVCKETGTLEVDRFLATSMYYPANYGYIPRTLAEDGDPVDVLVVTPAPIMSGAIIEVRPIGMLEMTDESGPDAKILAVPKSKLTKIYDHIEKPEDVSPHILESIKHFFEHYKDLDKGKWVKVENWADAASAKKEILASIERYRETEEVPA